jgi:signal transduction histidine kinase
LLAFARRAPVQPRPLDLVACLQETVALLSRTLGRGVEIAVVVGPGVWPVFADPAQVTQVIINLALNARDAMPQGGHITVDVANVILDEEQARQRAPEPGLAPREYVRLRVSDTGEGMTPEVQARAFEPFFTTKEAGRGTGLGLAIVDGIARQNRGWADCDSGVGAGTRISVFLPRHQPEPADPPGTPPVL